MRIDHLAVAAETLEEGTAWVEGVLDVQAGPVGRHERMGTWNRLISLGPEIYLEVIAIDSGAAPPGRPRWFGLDRFSGRPRPAAWIIACDDLGTQALEGAGAALAFARGPYRWRMLVPEGGALPFDGMQPAQIEWQGPHPAPALARSGCRLERLVVTHPEAARLAARLGGPGGLRDPRVIIEAGQQAALRAEIGTPSGVRVLA